MEEENKVYVGNLEYAVTEDELKDFITEQGFQVKEAIVVKDKYTGKSKGFGFVKFETTAEMEKAVETLNGLDFKSRKVNVSKARKKTDSRFNSRRDSSNYSGGYRQPRSY